MELKKLLQILLDEHLPPPHHDSSKDTTKRMGSFHTTTSNQPETDPFNSMMLKSHQVYQDIEQML
jgi:hypothetical protein